MFEICLNDWMKRFHIRTAHFAKVSGLNEVTVHSLRTKPRRRRLDGVMLRKMVYGLRQITGRKVKPEQLFRVVDI